MDIMRMGKNPNYLGSWDLEEEPNKRLTLTISKIVDEEVITAGQKETCTVCHFAENYKPLIMNLTNKKRLAKMYHTKQTENLIGKQITITIERVKAFGDIYDALRIVQQIPKQTVSDVICDVCGGKVLPIGKMSAEEVGNYTRAKYGACLCSKCATEAKAKKEAQEAQDET